MMIQWKLCKSFMCTFWIFKILIFKFSIRVLTVSLFLHQSVKSVKCLQNVYKKYNNNPTGNKRQIVLLGNNGCWHPSRQQN